jgi:hypothetical protein
MNRTCDIQLEVNLDDPLLSYCTDLDTSLSLAIGPKDFQNNLQQPSHSNPSTSKYTGRLLGTLSSNGMDGSHILSFL